MTRKKYKKEKNVFRIEEITLNANYHSSVGTNNPIVLDFYRALKNQKVFGSFCSLFKLSSLDSIDKKNALRARDLIHIGDIITQPFDSDFIKRVQILRKMIHSSNYAHNKSNSLMTIPKALECYAKEYFKNKKFFVEHSLLYYQFVFGTASVIIGLFMMFGLIYYFWGMLVLNVILITTFIYLCIVIYKLYNINLF